MAWTQEEIDRLKQSIISGVLTVRHLDGRLITYQSASEMLKVLAAAEAEVNSTRDRFSRASYSRE